MKNIITLTLLFLSTWTIAQTGTVRGFIYDKDNGEPVMFATVQLANTSIGTTTDLNGFYSIAEAPVGKYNLVATYIGYDSTAIQIEIRPNGITEQNMFMGENSVTLTTVNVTAKNEEVRSDVRTSLVKISPKAIKSLPGGEPDLAQYLQVLPGVVFTGDQGGQLYIRGGSPVQNKVLIDGMTIYNPFHSIGFFSVFETETIRNVDVYTGGFGAEYGGRTSAVVDITTRDGNKKRLSGLVSASPFQAKALIEGPISKLKEGGGSSTSFLLTAKHSYINETSKSIYSYINTAGLPYGFTDVYGKVSFNTSNGSKFNVFGFNYTDQVNYTDVANLEWSTVGGGTQFNIIPPNAKTIVGGSFAYSKYQTQLQEGDENPRSSSIGGFEGRLHFTNYGKNNEFKYGFEVNGFRTEFLFTNFLGQLFEEIENNTELAGFGKYKHKFGDALILEPSIRLHYYASLNDFSIEPRIGLKYNINNRLRIKFAGGLYSQNLISTVNEQDIVNLFVGFISSPERVNELNTNDKTSNRLQKSLHGIFGVEIDLTKHLELNVEPYYKKYTQLINLNRNKQKTIDPDYVSEIGDAYGIDFLFKYDYKDLYIWTAYSLGFVTRYDGIQTYSTNFDRRHNVNFVTSYSFGSKKSWEASARWNLGSGFPFTQTQGFYELFNFQDGLNTNYIQENGDIGIIYSDERNVGRLPYYHRLDLSLKHTLKFSKYSALEIIASVTNAYNRENIFYFDRVNYKRVNQLPILPSLGVTFKF